MSRKTCLVDGCAEPVKAKGLCGTHRMRLLRNGSTDNPGAKVYGTAEDRFEAYAERGLVTACWPWGGTITAKGYGQMWDGQKLVIVHRWAYERFVEPIPDGYTIDHIFAAGCHRKDCVNYLAHLEPVTNAVNTDRYWQVRRRDGGTSSRLRGVSYTGSGYVAQMYSRERRKNIALGVFRTETEAAEARDDAAWSQDGVNAFLNTPERYFNQYSPLTGQ